MKSYAVALLFASSSALAALTEPELTLTSPVNNAELVDYVNSVQSSWTAGKQERFEGRTLEHIAKLCGVLDNGETLPEREEFLETVDIPKNFDVREQWGDICPGLTEIRDQGSCGSCWAFGAVESMTDRICIASKGADQTRISAEDLLSCCSWMCGMGCNGGYPSGAWQYYRSAGLVDGGAWNSKSGCAPYEIQSCDHHVNGTHGACPAEESTPKCNKKCENGADYHESKHYGASAYSVSGVAKIQQEIMTHGSVEGAFTVYADFPTYRTGVYSHVTGSQLGGHAIKIMGWGVEDGKDYWLVANSWNGEWGNQGTFKIARGTNECGIESSVNAGLPKISSD